MQTDNVNHFVLIAALACFGPSHAATVKREQHIACPQAAASLVAAAPIIGPVDGPEPWSELHGELALTDEDGSLINRYDMSQGDSPTLEKWMICHYRDGTYKAVKLPIATRECGVTTKLFRADAANKMPTNRVVRISCK